MSTMRALILPDHGQSPLLVDRERPEPGPGEARIRLHAAALNRRDLWILHGQYPGITPPVILGSDGCGTVEAIADTDKRLIGQRVLICPSLNWGDDPAVQGRDFTILGNPRDGTFAETVNVPIANLVPCPDHLEDSEAGALPLCGLTAWRALVTRGQIQSSDRVLITGVGGGVASVAVVLSLAMGAEVWVSSSNADKLDTARSLGVTGGIRYDQAGWRKTTQKKVDGFDLILDGAGGNDFGELVRMLRPAGRLVYYGGTRGPWPAILPQHLFFKQVSILASTMGSPAEFADMVDFVGRHRLRPLVDQVFPLERSHDAFARLDSGAQMGKVVISMNVD